MPVQKSLESYWRPYAYMVYIYIYIEREREREWERQRQRQRHRENDQFFYKCFQRLNAQMWDQQNLVLFPYFLLPHKFPENTNYWKTVYLNNYVMKWLPPSISDPDALLRYRQQRVVTGSPLVCPRNSQTKESVCELLAE